MYPADCIVDFHSHILPMVDHGSESLDTTLFQLRSAQKRGINKILSTSHFYPTAHKVDDFLRRRESAYRLIKQEKINLPEIKLGAEVLLCNGIDRLPGLDGLCVYGTKHLLLELPYSDYSTEYTNTIERLLGNDFDVILAHADRYPKNIIEKLLPLGVKLQLNADSLTGFAKFKNAHLVDWISSGKVVALGSDIHGKDGKAYSRLRKAFAYASRFSDAHMVESEKIFSEAKTF